MTAAAKICKHTRIYHIHLASFLLTPQRLSPLSLSAFYLLHSWFKKSKRVSEEIRVSIKQAVLIYFSEDSGL